MRARDLSKVPGTVFQVTYSENTVVMDYATMQRTLRAISDDHSRFLFDSTDETVRKLAPGKILFLKTLTLRKVVALVPHPNSLIEVQTEKASLADAISDGVIKWNFPVRFGDMAAQPPLATPQGTFCSNVPRSVQDWWLCPPVAYAQDAMQAATLTGSFKGWDYSIVGTPSFNRLEVNALFKKEFEHATLEVHGKGYISNFEMAFDLENHDRGVFKYLDWKNKNLNGNLQIAWTAAYEGTGALTEEQKLEFTFPAPLKIPLELGGLPFMITFGGAMLFKPGFTGKGELARGKFQVDYNGVQGLSVKGGNAAADGEVHGDDKIIEAPALSAVGPEGFINGFVLPRVQLEISDEGALDTIAEFLPKAANSGFAQSGADAGGNAAQSGVDSAAQHASGAFKEDTKAAADAYAEVVVVSSIVQAGTMTSIGIPCEQIMLIVSGKIGAHATFLGKSALPDPFEIELFKHGTTQKQGTCSNE